MVAVCLDANGWRRQALFGSLAAAAVAGGAHAQGNATARRLQQDDAAAADAVWDQVASAINQGYCAQSYDVSSVTETMDNDPNKWVEAHNYYRACHGSPPVTWDATLAAYAKNWVEVLLTHCDSLEDAKGFVTASGHEPHDPASYRDEEPKNGENLALFQFPVIQMLPMDETSTVESWYREIETQCTNKGLTPGCDSGLNHYTALVWKSVSMIGCYSASRGTFKLVSCRYAPGPALEDEYCNLPNAQGECATDPLDPKVPALLNSQRCEPHGVIGVNGLPNGGAMDIAGQKVIPLPLLVVGWLQRAFRPHSEAPPPAEVPAGTLPQTMLDQHLAQMQGQQSQQQAVPQRLFGASGLPLLRGGSELGATLGGVPAVAAVAATAALAGCAVAGMRRLRAGAEGTVPSQRRPLSSARESGLFNQPLDVHVPLYSSSLSEVGSGSFSPEDI